MGVLQVICVVDDEMYPRMKKYAEADPAGVDPRYDYYYGRGCRMKESALFRLLVLARVRLVHCNPSVRTTAFVYLFSSLSTY
jgi:hypothetical protein